MSVDRLNQWLLSKLEPLQDSPRILVRDPLQLFQQAEGIIHNFARENGFTVIVSSTNLVFRDLYHQAKADPEVKKILVLDRTPARRRQIHRITQAPPLFYPDILSETPPQARIHIDLQQFLRQATGDPLWPAAANERQYSRLIAQNLPAVLRAHQNLMTANPGRFTDHDFQAIVAYAALGIPESAFRTLGADDYWRIGLQGHGAIEELNVLSPEITTLIKQELRKAPEPFCWFADREPDRVIRAFYLAVILHQHFPQWPLLMANIDPALQSFSSIRTEILKEAAPRLIAQDVQKACQDLQGVEDDLTKENLTLLLVDQLKIHSVETAAVVLEKESYSPLFRSLALLIALDDLLSARPNATIHSRLDKLFFVKESQGRPLVADSMPSTTWPDLLDAYYWSTEILNLRQVLAKGLKQIASASLADPSGLSPLLELWNEKRVNRLEYYLAALTRLLEHGQLLPRPEQDLPSLFGNAVHRLRTRIRLLGDEIQRQLDSLNRAFQQLVAAQYPCWVEEKAGASSSLILTSQFIRRCLKPHWDPLKEKAALLIFDGMRYDIWDELLRPLLQDRLEFVAEYPGCSILPSETQLTRKAISAGLFPNGFDSNAAEDRLLKESLSREFGIQEEVKVITPEGSGTGETVRYRAGNLDVYIFELCDKELHHIKIKKLPDGREVPSRPLSFVYELNIKNIIDTEVMSVVRALTPGTKVFITADHGFGRVGREALWFQDSNLNDRDDCSYLNCWLKVDCSSTYLPKKVLDNIIAFSPDQLRLPEQQTTKIQKTGQTLTKHFRAVVFPRIGFSFSRPGSHYNPDAFSHGGISIQEMIIPMAVMKVRAKERGWILIDSLEGPSEVLEGQPATFMLKLRRGAMQTLLDEDIRVDVDIESASPRRSMGDEVQAPRSSGVQPRQVVYVGSQGAQLPIVVCHPPEEATADERRSGFMERVLTVTLSWREGSHLARTSQTVGYKVQLNSERILRRLGNLGGILGLTPRERK